MYIIHISKSFNYIELFHSIFYLNTYYISYIDLFIINLNISNQNFLAKI